MELEGALVEYLLSREDRNEDEERRLDNPLFHSLNCVAKVFRCHPGKKKLIFGRLIFSCFLCGWKYLFESRLHKFCAFDYTRKQDVASIESFSTFIFPVIFQ